MRKVDVFVKGPGSGRETAIRSLTAAGLEVGVDQRRHPHAAQRLSARPSAAASEPPRRVRENTWLVTPDPITKKSRRLKVDLVGGDKNFEHPPFPPGQHGRAPDAGEGVPAPSCRRSRRPASPTASWRSSSAVTTRRRRRPGKTGENLLQILESRLDNVVYRAGLARTRRAARQLVTPRSLPGQRRSGRRPVLPRRAERHHRGAPASRSQTFPIELARQTVRRAPGPGLAAGRPRHAADPRAPAADARADRHHPHGAADRRALLEELTRSSVPRCPAVPRTAGRPAHEDRAADRGRPAGGYARPAASRGVI